MSKVNDLHRLITSIQDVPDIGEFEESEFPYPIETSFRIPLYTTNDVFLPLQSKVTTKSK